MSPSQPLSSSPVQDEHADTFEGVTAPKEIRPEKIEGDFGKLEVMRIHGIKMWEAYEIRPPAGSPGEHSPLAFFLSLPHEEPLWTARCMISCPDAEFVECLDRCPKVAVWSGAELADAPLRFDLPVYGDSPIWKQGLVAWFGSMTLGVSAAAFREQTSWELLLPNKLEELLIEKYERYFPTMLAMDRVKISGDFGNIEYDLEIRARDRSRELKVQSRTGNGDMLAQLYRELVLKSDECPGLQNAIDTILSDFHS